MEWVAFGNVSVARVHHAAALNTGDAVVVAVVVIVRVVVPSI